MSLPEGGVLTQAERPPFVSVVMAVRNEAGFIERSLGAVVGQVYPADRLEVVIADGESTDGTRGVIEKFRHGDSKLRLVDNPGRIVASGLNAALREAHGEIVVRVDGHTEIAPDYVQACVEALIRTGADNVGGRMTASGKGAFGRAVAAATSSRFGVGGARFHYSTREEWVDTVYLGAWRREIFDVVGGFDEELVRDQDDEFNYRLRAKGGRILLSPHVRSVYTVRGTARSLWRQYFQYGFWKVRVLQKHPRQMRPRQFAPPLLVGTLMLLAFGAPFLGIARWTLFGVAGIYLLASLLAAAGAARPAGLPGVFLLPVVFAVLHIAYGLGFLAGLWQFRGRWSSPAWAIPSAPPADQSRKGP
jgi:glycosyltransferase involved in cell wall biosynthesis